MRRSMSRSSATSSRSARSASTLERDDIGYIRISSFNEQTQDNLEKAIAKIKEQAGDKLKGYIIDLRNNPGGLLDQAISVSDAFLDRGEIVSTRGRNADETAALQRPLRRPDRRQADRRADQRRLGLGLGDRRRRAAGPQARDRSSARARSARARCRPSSRSAPNGAIRLTTARYYTPSGRSIQAKGIVPDIMIEQELPEELKAQAQRTTSEASLRGHLSGEDKEETGSSSYVPDDKEKDMQLKAAIDLLDGKTVNRDAAEGRSRQEGRTGDQAN